MIPTTAHVADAWIMGYDLFPMETLEVKKRLIRRAIEREHLIFFEHDPFVAAGYIRERDGKRYVEQDHSAVTSRGGYTMFAILMLIFSIGAFFAGYFSRS